MKKFGVILLAVMLIAGVTVFSTSCASNQAADAGTARAAAEVATPDPNFNYRVTGQFAGWGNLYEEEFMMENVARTDPRIASLSEALVDALYIYLYEYTPDVDNPAGWNVDYPGVDISVNGNFAVKFIRLKPDLDEFEDSGWDFDMWIPSTESGGMANLTPDTIYMPPDRPDEVAAAAGDGLGSVNGNPALIQGANTYYVVFAVMSDRSRAMGAIVK